VAAWQKRTEGKLKLETLMSFFVHSMRIATKICDIKKRTLNLQFFDVHSQLYRGCDHRRHLQHLAHYAMNWKSTRKKF